eukprot:g47234.t1
MSKRKLRQTRSLDSAIIRGYGTDSELAADDFDTPRSTCLRSKYASASNPLSPRSSAESLVSTRSLRYRQCPRSPLEKSLSANFSFDYDPRGGGKRTATWDLSFLPRNQSQNLASNTLFSPRKWLQRKSHQANSQSYIVWRSEVGITNLTRVKSFDVCIVGVSSSIVHPKAISNFRTPNGKRKSTAVLFIKTMTL